MSQMESCSEWSIFLGTHHTDLIRFIIDECVTGSTIESIECADISSIRFVNFLMKTHASVGFHLHLITDDNVTSALFECIRTSFDTRVRFKVRMLYIVSPRFTPP